MAARKSIRPKVPRADASSQRPEEESAAQQTPPASLMPIDANGLDSILSSRARREPRDTRRTRMSDAVVAVHFKDMSVIDSLREVVETRCADLADEFPELTHLHVTLSPDGCGHHASLHATGRHTEVASHAQAPEPGHAADRVLDQVRHQLRRTHEKRIYAQRRRGRAREPLGQ
jgi:ribosome-associated translation inhibitor RaiA